MKSQFSNNSRIAVFCHSFSNSKSENGSIKNDSKDSNPQNVLPTLFIKDRASSDYNLHDNENGCDTKIESDKYLG